MAGRFTTENAAEWAGMIDGDADVAEWFRFLLDGARINFHPDTRGDDYEPPLAPDVAAGYEAAMERCFAVSDDRVYGIGLAQFQMYEEREAARPRGQATY